MTTKPAQLSKLNQIALLVNVATLVATIGVASYAYIRHEQELAKQGKSNNLAIDEVTRASASAANIASTTAKPAAEPSSQPQPAIFTKPQGTQSLDDIPAIVNKTFHNKGQVIVKFKVTGLPLDAWGVLTEQNPTKAEIVYTTQDGLFALPGPLLAAAPNGELSNESQRYTQQFSPKIDMVSIWDALEKNPFVKWGAADAEAKFILYGFLDPNCGYCHKAADLLEPYTHVGLQVRWLPVGVIAPTSSAKAAGILENPSPVTALAESLALWDSKKNEAFVTLQTIKDKTNGQLDTNAQLMKKIGATGTPAFVFKNAQGEIQKVGGVIVAQEIPKITGLTLAKTQ